MPVALPNELYLTILHHLEDYPIALAQCSRVSKAFRDYAQPLLWEFVDLRDEEEGKLMVEGAAAAEGNRLGRIARKLRIQPFNFSEEWDLAAVLRTLPEVEDVWIEDVRPFEDEAVVAFSQLTNLKNLTFTDLYLPLPDDPRSFHFPYLTLLSLNDICLPTIYLDNLFTTTALPSLEALAIGDIRNYERGFNYFPSLSADFCAQLSMLQIGRPNVDEDDFPGPGNGNVPPYLPSNLDPTLVPLLACTNRDSVIELGIVPKVAHIAVSSSQGWEEAVETLDTILDNPDQIKSFWLPLGAQPPDTDVEQAVWRGFARDCRDAGIEIHWMDIEDCPASGGILMEDFLPFAKELRRKEREAASRAGQ